MILKRISILNYKNLEQAELEFSPKMNCFIGQNGMGKTNLLDAVYYLSFCKSATNPIDSQNIRHEGDFFVIQGFYETNQGDPEEVYCGLKRRQKKQFKRNKKEYSAGTGPGLDDVLFAGRVHLLDAIKKARLNERTLLQTSAHYYSLTLSATSCDGE